MNPAFTCLYFLENETHCIVEIQRTDLKPDADIAEVYRWMFLDKVSKQVLPLTFRSMDSSGEVQERYFEQGYLKFNTQNGTYIEKFNSAQHHLSNHSGVSLSRALREMIIAYLLA